MKTLGDYTLDFKIIGEHKLSRAIRFELIEIYESYYKNIHMNYDAGYILFTGFFDKMIATELTKVDSSESGERIDYKQEIVDFLGNSCYTPTSGYCFSNAFEIFNRKRL